jgi:predicted ATPase
MRLKRLEIRNYKSLRDVVIEPTPLTVLVGPNAAGKSNFADALDFLGEVYRWDLEGAVAKKGGYENICYRQIKRSGAPIRFRVVLEVLEMDWDFPKDSIIDFGIPEDHVFDHLFEFKAKSQAIQAPFSVVKEEYRVSRREELLGEPTPIAEFFRVGNSFRILPAGLIEALPGRVSESGLLVRPIENLFLWGDAFPGIMERLRLFQLSALVCRQAGVPTPNPDLDRFGSNLPAVLEYLKRIHTKEYSQLLNMARRIMPSLEAIEIDYTHTKTLGLFLRESGFKRPWTSEDISDGTIQSIALLAAIFDPRIKILVIEEPENSVHPWAIRTFVEAFRLASEQKQIILTTHSPILIDQIRPEELWVVRRPGAETLIDPVLSLDPSLKEAWGQGKFTLSEYLDSGALPAAVPASGL